jgi:hypothetical protein
MHLRRQGPLAAALVCASALCTACDGGPVEVSDPFYLWHLEDPRATALFRCVDVRALACAIDGLPDPPVLAAGANARFVVLRKTEGYFYFRRAPQERRGWGRDPEVIIGPLSDAQFGEAQQGLGLPDANVMP